MKFRLRMHPGPAIEAVPKLALPGGFELGNPTFLVVLHSSPSRAVAVTVDQAITNTYRRQGGWRRTSNTRPARFPDTRGSCPGEPPSWRRCPVRGYAGRSTIPGSAVHISRRADYSRMSTT